MSMASCWALATPKLRIISWRSAITSMQRTCSLRIISPVGRLSIKSTTGIDEYIFEIDEYLPGSYEYSFPPQIQADPLADVLCPALLLRTFRQRPIGLHRQGFYSRKISGQHS